MMSNFILLSGAAVRGVHFGKLALKGKAAEFLTGLDSGPEFFRIVTLISFLSKV